MYKIQILKMLFNDEKKIAGATRIVSLDLYRKEIQGFFSVPVDNLRASPYLLEYIKENVRFGTFLKLFLLLRNDYIYL